MNHSWHALAGELVLRELETNAQGLSKEEAARRLLNYGQNKLPEAKSDGYPTIFLRQFESPLIYLLLAASVVMYLTGDLGDALIVLFVLVFNSIVGAVQEGRAQNTLRALKRFAETSATVLRDGKELIIRDCEVVRGDIVLLEEGSKVPADARLLSSRSLQVDEASLTGESEPISKVDDAALSAEAPLADRTNMVFKGSNITSGTGRAVVVATGLDTEIGKIASELSGIDTDVPLKTNIRNLSRAIIWVVMVGGALLFLAGLAYGHTAATMFSTVVALAVSVIPEGLPIVMTLVLATGVWRMGKRNVLVKKLQAVEALGQARIIAVDKTGTLTRNELTVERIWTNGKMFTVTGSGYEPTGSVMSEGIVVEPPNHPELLLAGKIGVFSANAQTMYSEEEHRWRVSGDPTEAALAVFGAKTGFTKTDLEGEAPLLSEMPFDYRLKYHATLHQDGDKNLAAVVGAPEAVLALCTSICVEEKNEPLTPETYEEIERVMQGLSREGLRVIGFASRRTEHMALEDRVLEHLTFGGFYAMRDALRPEVKDAMARAEGAGIKVVMITGDHRLTATSIAREIGIFKEGDEVATGEEIDALNDVELAHKLANVSVFARVTPEHKLRIIRAYRSRGDIVAMTGDGVNDAPSLVAADLGVAMGAIGTEVAKEAADIVLLDDNFGSIVSAVEEGRSIYKTIKKVVLYLFSTSVGEALTIIAALFLGMPLPVLAAQIIWLNFVTDGFLDVALAMEPKEKNILAEPFKRPAKYLIDRLMLIRMLVMAIPMAVGTLWVFSQYVALGDMTKALTMSMTTLAVFQWFNAWNCRSEKESLLRMNPFGNIYLIGATLIVIALQVLALHLPVLQNLLHTTPLSQSEWLLCIAVASSILVAEELRKLLRRLAYRFF
ncbi:MAG TPA: HAD-IC family P-type ATPase [Candidatus Paceibacterota bacterium]